MSDKTKLWRWADGEQGESRMRVAEVYPGSMLYVFEWDKSRGNWRKHSLGHRDKRRARRECREIVKRLEERDHELGDVTLGWLIDLYLHHESEGKAAASLKWLEQNLAAWRTYLGGDFRVADLSLHEWSSWGKQRLSGAIDGRGRPVENKKRKTVAPGTVNLGYDALLMACNWATRWRVDGHPILRHNPVKALPKLKDRNRKRTVRTHDDYLKILDAAEKMTMQVEWDGMRETVPNYLADILVIAEGTGRRIGAVRQLRYSDLRLDEGPNGKIRWRADTDKGRRETVSHLLPDVAARLRKVIRERPALGDAPLFPAPRNRNEPVDWNTLAKYLREGEAAARVPHAKGDNFHGLRRKFVTERKHHADVDVASTAGWASVTVMKQAYQQADDAGQLAALSNPRRIVKQGTDG
jgi:integrase